MISHRTGAVVTFTAHNEKFRFFVTNPEDEIQKYHNQCQLYEREELDIMRHYYRSGTAFADIGSNIGNHAVFAERVLRAPEIILFEPNPVAISLLEINLSLNDCTNMNREFLGYPVADAVGRRMAVTYADGNNLGNTVFGFTDDGPFRTITCDFALAQRLPGSPPLGFVKIDTEFMEFETLNGLVRTLEIWRPNMFVEALESREAELMAWAQAHRYKIVESVKRYETVRNYIMLPD